MPSLKRVARVFLRGMAVAPVIGTVVAFAMKRRITPAMEPDANQVAIAGIFEPVLFRSTATAFRGGSVDFWYGGGVIDLRGATLDPNGACLRVRAVFGGGQILVPATWNVTGRVLGIGGYGDARRAVERDPDAPSLRIDGLAVFGGFAIASDISEAETRGLETAIARRAGARGRVTDETRGLPVVA